MTGNAEDDDPSGPLDSADAFGDKHVSTLHMPVASQLEQNVFRPVFGALPSVEEAHSQSMCMLQAEHLVLAAYTSLLLGCLMRDCSANRHEVLNALPDHSPRPIIRVLKAFLAFQKQVSGGTTPPRPARGSK